MISVCLTFFILLFCLIASLLYSNWCFFYCLLSSQPDEEGEEPAAKRRRTEKKEGERLISEFLTRVKELSKTSLSEDKLKARIDEMKKDIIAKDNAYVQAVINSCK